MMDSHKQMFLLVIGDTIPVLLQLYFPQYSSFTDRSLVISFIAVFLVRYSFFPAPHIMEKKICRTKKKKKRKLRN